MTSRAHVLPAAATALALSMPLAAAAQGRTPWGDPDLQGIWANDVVTPLERPAGLGERQELTDEELAEAAAANARRQIDTGGPRAGDPILLQGYNQFWMPDRDVSRQTSLIVDPPDGRVPPLTPAGARREALTLESSQGVSARDIEHRRHSDGPEGRSLWERCLTRGLPRLPDFYNNNALILQTPDHVVVHMEMIHETRVIPVDRRPHLDDGIRQWHGDPRGRWEGDALVVETTNFSGKTNFKGSRDGLRLVERFTRTDADTLVYRKIENSLRLMRLSPLTHGFSPLALTPSYDDWYQDWQNHELYDDYWQQIGNGVTKHFANAADVPILLIGEWYDAFLGGTLDQLAAYGEGRQSPVHLVISGGEHGNVYSLRTYSGDVDLGPTAPIHVGTEMMKWFDQHVKGKDRGVKPGNLIRAFRIEGGDGVMNAAGRLQAGGTWQEFTEWPPADSSPVSYYLGADRSLTSVTPATGSITYAHDPANPVPSIGGRVSSGLPVRAGPQDQRCRIELPHCDDDLPLRLRPDVLAFETPALERDVEVSGPVVARLWVSSSAVDTDFVVNLIDQYPPTADYPEGYAMNVAEGIVRARFRSFEQDNPKFRRAYAIKEEPLVPGEMYEVTVDLWSTSYLFREGHRIRVDVSSSSFPQFDVNPNTGEPFAKRVSPPVVAQNTIYMGADHASSISLQVRP